jgi:hypothetical protein
MVINKRETRKIKKRKYDRHLEVEISISLFLFSSTEDGFSYSSLVILSDLFVDNALDSSSEFPNFLSY